MPNRGKLAGIDGTFDEAGWRKRISKMSDEKLIGYGKSCRYVANPGLSSGIRRRGIWTKRCTLDCALKNGGVGIRNRWRKLSVA